MVKPPSKIGAVTLNRRHIETDAVGRIDAGRKHAGGRRIRRLKDAAS